MSDDVYERSAGLKCGRDPSKISVLSSEFLKRPVSDCCPDLCIGDFEVPSESGQGVPKLKRE